MTLVAQNWWRAALAPRSVAVIGASENPDKVGGRPIQYMRRFGYRGDILPINPTRADVQGVRAFPHLRDLDQRPDLAIIALPAAHVPEAVADCAAAGVPASVVLASGFGETGEQGRKVQDAMLATARAAGMRLIGPNTQGIANFGTGTVASFATLFGEIAPQDGPVAIVSQSGAMSVVPYAHLRYAGIGVRYAHATGNEADVTVADLAESALADPDIRLLLLYMEHIESPDRLAAVAEAAHRRAVPVLVLKAGRSARGAAAAASHTGVLASEDRVVDAFLRRHGLLRVDDMHGLVNAAGLFLAGQRARGNRLAVISNSGASCVLAADLAESHGLSVPPLPPAACDALARELPPFANPDNPIDLTGALLSDSTLFPRALGVLEGAGATDLLLVSLPNAGKGYDVEGFAAASGGFAERTGVPVAITTPNPNSAKSFRERGMAVFEHDSDAVAALAQLARWTALRDAARLRGASAAATHRIDWRAEGDGAFLSEWDALTLLRAYGLPVPRMALIGDAAEIASVYAELGRPLVIKGCSPDIPHKSEHGLVRVGVADAATAAAASADMMETMRSLGARIEGVILAEMVRGDLELMLGARRDPKFGVVVTVGAGGTFVEALDDAAVLIAPFGEALAAKAWRSLRIARLFPAHRGEPAVDVDALARIAVQLGGIMQAHPDIASIDLNPILVARGGDATIVDALVERAEHFHG